MRRRRMRRERFPEAMARRSDNRALFRALTESQPPRERCLGPLCPERCQEPWEQCLVPRRHQQARCLDMEDCQVLRELCRALTELQPQRGRFPERFLEPKGLYPAAAHSLSEVFLAAMDSLEPREHSRLVERLDSALPMVFRSHSRFNPAVDSARAPFRVTVFPVHLRPRCRHRPLRRW